MTQLSLVAWSPIVERDIKPSKPRPSIEEQTTTRITTLEGTET